MLQWTFLGLLLVHDWLDDNTGVGHKHWVANITFYGRPEWQLRTLFFCPVVSAIYLFFLA